MSKKMEENNQSKELGFNIDETPIEMREVPIEAPKTKPEERVEYPSTPKINILRNERIIVRHINKQKGLITDPRHVNYGGMGENSIRTYVAPRLRSGSFVNVLTNEEKSFLEDAMGYERGALSAIKKVNNFWETVSVRLTKQDNFLDLSSPDDFIKYKILLANKDFIAPSLQAIQDDPKATYEYVLISEGEEDKYARDNISITGKCYKEFGKVEDDVYVLRVIVETLEGKNTAPNSKLEFLQGQIYKLIQANSKSFYKVITDPYLKTKALIKKAVEAGVIVNRDNHYFLREDNTPLCEANEEATLSSAAKYLNMPKHQSVLFAIQAKVKD